MTSIRQPLSTPSSAPRQRALEKAAAKPSAAQLSRPSAASGASSGVSSFTPAPARPKPVVLQPTALRATATAASLPTAGGATPERLITKDFLNLRSVPSKDGNTPLATIPPGAELQVTPDETGTTRKGDYVHVAWNDNGTARTGWVAEAHVRPSSAPTPGNQTDAEALDSARALYINQFDAELQVSGDGRNANCGPTSVVMALRDQGLSLPDIPGVAHNGTNGADVQVARYHMYKGVDASRDGVVPVDPNNPDAGYQYAAMSGAGNENSTYTDFSGVRRAVEQAGGTAEYLSPNAEGVAQALREGKAVVVAGDFVEVINGVKQEKTDTWTRGGGAEGHIVAVTGLTEEGNFIVCDPAHPDRGPIIATPEELEAFMRGNAAAMSVAGR